jgi:putative transposase
MKTFKQMVNEAIVIGIEKDLTSLKQLSMECYPIFKKYKIYSAYKLHAISRTSGILQNRKKSINRGIKTKTPYLKKEILINSYDLKIEDGKLRIPLGDRKFFNIKLNKHVIKTLSTALKVHSFCISALGKLSICYSIADNKIECTSIVGIDRNLNNLTVGNKDSQKKYNLEKCNQIIENTKSIYSGFKRNDLRIRKKIYSKYGSRRKNRVNQILHKISNEIIVDLKENKQGIAFEKLTNIRKLYRKGNGQGRNFRGKMNSWSFAEIERLITYKAEWEGIKVIRINPYYTSSTCHQCGKRTQGDIYKRTMSCINCNLIWDRDILAVINIAKKGGLVLDRSKGLPSEAMVVEPVLGNPQSRWKKVSKET